MAGGDQAVLDLLCCVEAVEKKAKLHSKGDENATGVGERRRARASLQAARELRHQYQAVLRRQDGSKSFADRMRTLRRLVISNGLPCEPDPGGRKRPPAAGLAHPDAEQGSLRSLVWKALLGTVHVDAMLYMRLVEQGPSWMDTKIRDDTFRTFRGDKDFQQRVPEEKLLRLNNAFVRLNCAAAEAGAASLTPGPGKGDSAGPSGRRAAAGGRGRTGVGGGGDGSGGHRDMASEEVGPGPAAAAAAAAAGTAASGGTAEPPKQLAGGYVQGMTVLCAPLLFVMPEPDAFFCFQSLLTRHMPRYVAANLDGAHTGCTLVDRVLAVVDPVLFNYLESKFLTASIYAFPLLMSLHACVPPLEEVLKLWDALFAFGVHLEVLVCVAQCILLREKLLQDPNPYHHLNVRYLPPLDADTLVTAAFALIPHIPADLLDDLARHPFAEEAPQQQQQQQQQAPKHTYSYTPADEAPRADPA